MRILAIAATFDAQSATAAIVSGLVLGLVSITRLRVNGNVLGISGIVGGLSKKGIAIDDAIERFIFMVGILLAGIVLELVVPSAFGTRLPSMGVLSSAGVARVCIGGWLVGYGTALGNGCTSGHGIAGNARFSKRSMAATCVFMLTGFLAASLSGTVHWLEEGAEVTSMKPAAEPYVVIGTLAGFAVALSLGVILLSLRKEDEGHQMMRRGLVDGWAGYAFGLGIGFAGMASPTRVAAFLDVSRGLWDPTLGLVMCGALAVAVPMYAFFVDGAHLQQQHGSGKNPLVSPKQAAFMGFFKQSSSIGGEAAGEPARRTLLTNKPVLSSSYLLPPPSKPIDWQLVLGASLFGIGWGLVGICPGPGLLLLSGTVGAAPGMHDVIARDSAGTVWVFFVLMTIGWLTHHRFLPPEHLASVPSCVLPYGPPSKACGNGSSCNGTTVIITQSARQPMAAQQHEGEGEVQAYLDPEAGPENKSGL